MNGWKASARKPAAADAVVSDARIAAVGGASARSRARVSAWRARDGRSVELPSIASVGRPLPEPRDEAFVLLQQRLEVWTFLEDDVDVGGQAEHLLHLLSACAAGVVDFRRSSEAFT